MIFNRHSVQNYICTCGTFNDVMKYYLTYSEMQKFLLGNSSFDGDLYKRIACCT